MGTVPRVVVTGMGAETALGHGVGALWEGALLGRSAIRPVTRFDIGRFYARQAALIDRERGPDGAELE
ncbi:MAG: beta-ketoacyl synthase N-terminal-like domain-containing protein, partial [Thermoanaerobaculia bacterium]